jgi:hypothetical protein
VVAFEDAGHGVEEEVEVDGFGEDGEDLHAEGVVEEVGGEVLGEEDGGGCLAALVFAEELDDLEAAEAGHVGVEDGEVDLGGFEEVEGLAAGADGEGVDALGFEEGADVVGPPLGFVGEEDGEAVMGLVGLDHKRRPCSHGRAGVIAWGVPRGDAT